MITYSALNTMAQDATVEPPAPGRSSYMRPEPTEDEYVS